MPTVKPQVKRTYGSQNRRPLYTSANPSLESSLSSSARGTEPGSKRKRPLADLFPNGSNDSPPRKNAKTNKHTTRRKPKGFKKEVELAQLHFCIDQSILRTCPLCNLSYTRGAPDDENLHKSHCARVQKGMEWGREEDKQTGMADGIAVLIAGDVVVGHGERGRIVAVKPSASGKLGSKISGYLETVNLALSAPDIPTSLMESCKVYLFLLRTPECTKEKIVGCVVAQRIASAMQVTTHEEVSMLENAAASLIHVEGNLYCKPEDLPTPMGVPRLFVSSAHRRKGIALALLDVAAKTFVYGHKLDPAKGEVAFSQPTSMGRRVMEKWGRGGVRVYKE